jgi:hypothetical protein
MRATLDIAISTAENENLRVDVDEGEKETEVARFGTKAKSSHFSLRAEKMGRSRSSSVVILPTA